MNLFELQEEVKAWSARNFPNNKPHHPLLGIVEEVGELSHAHLKLEQGIRGTPEELHNQKIDAVGDILIYLADYCWRNSIEMNSALMYAWNQVRLRDWQNHKKDGVK